MSVMLSLESKLRPPKRQRTLRDLSTISLPEYLRSEAERSASLAIRSFGNEPGNLPLVVIIDQFEEILLLNPPDPIGQADFFRQLGDALERQHLWALLSMREEYLGD